jgi:hypothetical protein
MARVSIFKSPDELTGEARRIAERIVDTRKSLEGPFSVWMQAHSGPSVLPIWVRWYVGRVRWNRAFARSQHWSSAVTSRPNMCGASRV